LDIIDAHPEINWDYDSLSENTFGVPVHKGIAAMEKESRQRITARTQQFKEELIEKCWNPDRLQRIISENTQVQWNYEKRLYMNLNFRVMAKIF
jgi:hypothetical protein